jgi:hypothetical protein
VHKPFFRIRTLEKTVGLGNEDEVNKLSRGNFRLAETPGLICSLNEAWCHTLDSCVIDITLSEAIFPVMRACFFGGAMNALLLLQNGHGDQLAADIAGFIMKEPPRPDDVL